VSVRVAVPLLLVFLLAGCVAAPTRSATTGDPAAPSVETAPLANATAAAMPKLVGADGVTIASDAAAGTVRVGLGSLVAPHGGIIACGSSCNTSEARTGMVVADGSLISHNDVALNALGPDRDSVIYFFDQGRQNGEYLQWSDAADRFRLSNDAEVLGELLARGPVGTVNAASVPNGSYVFTPALEGNEMAIYLRGSASLVDGKATVTFPPAFAALVGDGAVTAQVTLTSPAPALWVSEKTSDHVTVETVTPSTGSATFDYFVQALRVGGESFHTIR
jgi:hypothetical protein